MAYVSQFTGPQMDQAFGNALNQRPTYTLYLVDDRIDTANIMDFAEFVRALSNNAIFQIKHLHMTNSSHSQHTLNTDITAVSNAITRRSSYSYQLVWEDTTFGLERYKLEVMSTYTSWDNVNISYADILEVIPEDGRVTFPKIAGQGVLPTDFCRFTIEFPATINSGTFNPTEIALSLTLTGCYSVNHVWEANSQEGKVKSPAFYWKYEESYPNDPYRMQDVKGIYSSLYGTLKRPILGFSPFTRIIPNSSNRFSIVCPLIRTNKDFGCQVGIYFGDSVWSELKSSYDHYNIHFNSFNVFGESRTSTTDISGDLTKVIQPKFRIRLDGWPAYDKGDVLIDTTILFN